MKVDSTRTLRERRVGWGEARVGKGKGERWIVATGEGFGGGSWVRWLSLGQIDKVRRMATVQRWIRYVLFSYAFLATVISIMDFPR